MSNSPLISYTKISPNKNSPRKYPISKITIHHMAGDLSVEQCGNIFAPSSRQASSNYGIGSDGRIALYVDEADRSWCSSNRENDEMAVTIEVANNNTQTWSISDAAMNSLIKLCADICKRNNIEQLVYTGDKTGNLTMHRWFAATGCPGDWLAARFPYIANEVNKILNAEKEPTVSTPIDEGFYTKFEHAMDVYRKKLQDNDANDWSIAARDWAINSAIVKGDAPDINGNINYMWEDFLTREQAAIMMHRLYLILGGGHNG